MKADLDAFEVVKQLTLTDGERQYFLPVARGEGFFGLGWGNPSKLTIEKSAQFGIDPKAGVGSNNWGAIQGVGTAGSFPHVDSGWMIPDENGQPTNKHWLGKGPKVWGDYVANYKRYNTAAEGAADMARILLKQNVKDAIAAGDLKAAVYAQHANHYFELDPEKYLAAVKRNYDILTEAIKWPILLKIGGSAVEEIAKAPLVPTPGQPSLEQPLSFSGEPSELPEAGFLRGQKYSVPGIQDEPEKKI